MPRIRVKTSETPEGHITTTGRRRLSRKDFALPPGPEEIRRGIKGRYPINERARAQNALGKAARFATPEEQEQVMMAVHRRYPGMEIKEIRVSPRARRLTPKLPRLTPKFFRITPRMRRIS
jgi:hypothetical protein